MSHWLPSTKSSGSTSVRTNSSIQSSSRWKSGSVSKSHAMSLLLWCFAVRRHGSGENQPAVHGNGLADDVGCEGRREEQRHPRHVGGRAHAAYRNAADGVLQALGVVGGHLCHLGGHKAWR